MVTLSNMFKNFISWSFSEDLLRGMQKESMLLPSNLLQTLQRSAKPYSGQYLKVENMSECIEPFKENKQN